LISSGFETVSVLIAHDYLEHGENKEGQEIMIYKAVNISRLAIDQVVEQRLNYLQIYA
jgi:hypothetical protein